MKNLFSIIRIYLSLIIVMIFISCDKKDDLQKALLLEQSKDLILANQREISGLLSLIAEENLEEKRETSIEYEKIFHLYNELEKYNLNIENAERKRIINMINEQNIKFKHDDAFATKMLKFEPVKIEELKDLDDASFKFYTTSKISRLYVHSAGNIFIKRKHRRDKEAL